MAGWHHRLDGHGFGWTPGVGNEQGGLACCDSWGHKKSDATERLNWIELTTIFFYIYIYVCVYIYTHKPTFRYTYFRKHISYWNDLVETWIFSSEEYYFIRKGTIKNRTWRNLTMKYTLGFENDPGSNFYLSMKQKWTFKKLKLPTFTCEMFLYLNLRTGIPGNLKSTSY